MSYDEAVTIAYMIVVVGIAVVISWAFSSD